MIALITLHLLAAAILTAVWSHLLAVALLLWLTAAVAFGVGLTWVSRRPEPKPRPLPPTIRLDWANEIPIAVVESDASTVDEVSRWLDAAREGPVLRV